MTDVRCPKCAKPNPEEREECQFCQARLKPLIFNPLEGEGGSILSRPRAQESEESEAYLPDWLRNLRQPETEAESTDDESSLPDWMQEIQDQQDDPPEEADVGAVPDWLSRINEPEKPKAVEGSSEGLPSAFEQADYESDEDAASYDLPDWLSDDTPIPTQDPDQVFIEEVSQESELPDWLSGSGFGDKQEQDESSLDKDDQSGGLPDWLAGTGSVGQFEQAGDPSDKEDESESTSLSDWLEGADFGSDQETPSLPAFTEPDEDLQSADVPDWLAKLEQNAAGNTPEESDRALLFDEENEGEPYSLPDETYPTSGSYQEDVEELEESDLGALPEWIDQVSEDAQSGSGQPEKDMNSSLEKAELPGWLEAMRPVETFVSTPASSEKDAPVERAGPLAGLHSVLPVNTSFAKIKKPETYSVKLQVTENQQLHAEILENLLETEDEPKPLLARQGIGSQTLLRVLVALALIIPLLLLKWMNPGITAFPAGNSDEAVVQTAAILSNLTPGAPVLLVVDYEPGFSGELDATAAGLVEQIIVQGGRLLLVSTLPDGAVNAERFLWRLGQETGIEISGYVNLGFITGGAAGLRTFAESPRQVFPYTLDTLRVWESHPFNTVESAADFHLVVVMTENPSVARAWIEQVQPVLQNSLAPLVMVVSAQAEPLVRPYYTAFPRQVAGLIAGLPGGAAFESHMGITRRASNVWEAFSLGLLVGAVLLVLGGIFSAVMTILSRRKNTEAG